MKITPILAGGFALLVLLISIVTVPASAHAASYDRAAAWESIRRSGSTTPAQSDVSPEQVTRWRQSSGFQSQIGTLGAVPIQGVTIPVLFGVKQSDLTRNFGDPRSGGRTHEGLDILAPRGTPIVSPAEAVVLSTGNGSSSGYYAYTAVAGGETFVYMHLDQPSTLAPGTKINRGALIGYVGNTGNASGGVTHLHFEIRSNRTALDPYGRLTADFPLGEKINYLVAILNQRPEVAYAELLVSEFSDEFLAAKSQNIGLPPIITGLLAGMPFKSGAASGDLMVGSSGASVVTLQNLLISQNKGPAARALAGAGATGNFGAMTKAALVEYQAAAGINPADGFYGAATRAYIAQSGQGGTVATAPVASAPVSTPPSSVIITNPSQASASGIPVRDLDIGARGTDVSWLQSYLISVHAGTAAMALADAGATGYFGPVTQRALAEYQSIVRISPAVGYFGSVTRAYFRSIIK